MLFSSSSLCLSVSSRASCLALSAASMSFLAVWELSDSWEPARYRQHMMWGQELWACAWSCGDFFWGGEGEIVCAPASLAGCLQGSEWNVSIRKLSFSGVFVWVFEGRGSLGQSLWRTISKAPRWCQSCLQHALLKTAQTLPHTHTHSFSLCCSLGDPTWFTVWSNVATIQQLTTAETVAAAALYCPKKTIFKIRVSASI